MKKRRGDAKLWNLEPKALASLEEWLFDAQPVLTYAQARERLQAEYGVRCSLSSLSEWRSQRAQERMLDKISQNAAKANSVMEAFRSHPSDSYEALLKMIGQAAFEQQMSGGEALSLDSLKDLAELTRLGLSVRAETAKIELKQKKLGLDERKVQLLERKAAQAEAAEGVVKDTTLTPEEQQARIKEIFGIA